MGTDLQKRLHRIRGGLAQRRPPRLAFVIVKAPSQVDTCSTTFASIISAVQVVEVFRLPFLLNLQRLSSAARLPSDTLTSSFQGLCFRDLHHWDYQKAATFIGFDQFYYLLIPNALNNSRTWPKFGCFSAYLGMQGM